MPAISASAPAKSILFGEHAVVYLRPAIAIPISDLRTSVSVLANPKGQPGIQLIDAPDIHIKCFSNQLSRDNPIRAILQKIIDYYHIDHYPACEIRIVSQIPMAAGLGSSASTAVALVRALIGFLGKEEDDKVINELAFHFEKVVHGDPSGVDNAVVASEKPIYFVKNGEIEFLSVMKPMHFIIADSGVKSLTRDVVAQVKENWVIQKAKYESIFDQIGIITNIAKEAISLGRLQEIGGLLNQNHALLKQMGVSCDELDRLVEAANQAGALGAKLCGKGKGGNMIALMMNEEDAGKVQNALIASGAVKTYSTVVKATK
jgi:mevalonate kinase